MKIISFFFHKNHIYLFIIFIILISQYFIDFFIHNYIHKKYKLKDKLYRFYLLCFRYAGQSLLLLPYFISYYDNKKSEKKKITNNNLSLTILPVNNIKEFKNNNIFILFYAFILSMMELLLNTFSNSIAFHEDNKNFKYKEIQICIIIICYYKLFNITLYIHQKICFYIFFFILIFKLIYNIFELDRDIYLFDLAYNFVHYFFVGFKIIILKYLINYFFISGYLLLGLEGLLDLIFHFVYYYLSFGIEKNIFEKIYYLLFLIITIEYFILHIFLTILITKFDPILYTLSSLFFTIIEYFLEEIDKYIIVNIIINIISCFCILIFSEIIQLNFCNLNKNTKINILKREKNEKKLNTLELYN